MSGGQLKLEDGASTGHYAGVKAPDGSMSSDAVWSLPSADGTTGQILTTDGSLNLIWVDNLDSTLQANINIEITSRQNSDSTLTANLNNLNSNLNNLNSNINNEITSRQNSDSTLTANLNSEITSRINSDSTLQANLNSEITARINADSTLLSSVTILNNRTATSAIALAVDDRVFADTQTTAAFTGTLPLSPNIGDEIQVCDSKGYFGTNAFTFGRNGQNIMGSASDFVANISHKMYRAIYVDATYGWAIYY